MRREEEYEYSFGVKVIIHGNISTGTLCHHPSPSVFVREPAISCSTLSTHATTTSSSSSSKENERVIEVVDGGGGGKAKHPQQHERRCPAKHMQQQ